MTLGGVPDGRAGGPLPSAGPRTGPTYRPFPENHCRLGNPGTPATSWAEPVGCAVHDPLEGGLNLLDTVALLVDVKGWSMGGQDVGLSRGQVGTVIEARDAEVVIVEFAGTNGVTYALASVASASLLRLHHDPPVAS